MNKKPAFKILKLLLGLSLAFIIIHLALKYVSVVIYEEKHGFMFELSNRFDMNDENSVPQWMSQTMFLLTGLSAFLASYMSAARSATRRLWLLIGVAATLLSLDDAATLHEFILQTIHNTFFVDTAPTLLRNAWLLIAPLVVIGLIVLLVMMIKTLPRRTTLLLMLGLVVFFTGALLVDSFINNIPERSFMGQGVMGAVEGGVQLIGISILLFGVLDYLELHHAKSIRAALSRLKSPNS